MSKRFYRFRSLKSLFEFKELEKQTIYFASPQELNDPMEGFRNLVFKGDTIVYKNLFKHYLMCLTWISSLYIITGEEHHKITVDDIPIYNGFDDFPTPTYKELFENISKDFFRLCEDFINTIATRTTPIKKDEIKLYLTLFHSIAVEVIEKNYAEKQFIGQRKTPYRLDNTIFKKFEQMIDVVENTLKESKDESIIDTLFLIQKQIQDEFTLINNVNSKLAVNAPNRNFLLVNFVNIYLENLEKLMYPNWYTACFMTESHNSSVWGHYGDSHKGICLIFESNEKESITIINGKIGENLNGIIKGKKEHKFYKVKYEEGYPEIDFFRSIGRLPIPKLYSTWYGENGEISSISNTLEKDEDKWRKNYWDIFYKNILIKTKDWEYENEYRLILNGLLDDKIDKENRILQYDFKHLKGLIFGIKTPLEDKLKVIDIIGAKCKANNINDFEFYQAYYCHINKNIQHIKMSFIKFNKDKG